jgi:hypothetical protein
MVYCCVASAVQCPRVLFVVQCSLSKWLVNSEYKTGARRKRSHISSRDIDPRNREFSYPEAHAIAQVEIKTTDDRPLECVIFLQPWSWPGPGGRVAPPPAVSLTEEQSSVGSHMEDVQRNARTDEGGLLMA